MENITLESFGYAFLLTLFAGLSTAIGAAMVFLSKKDNKKLLSIGLGFSAGVMLYVSFVEILQKSKLAFSGSFGDILGELFALAFFFIGIIFAAFIDKFIPQDVNPHELKTHKELTPLRLGDTTHTIEASLRRTGIFTAIAIGIHNFPEGFATFIASIENVTLGISIALAIALHNIPEGMSVSLPIYHATGNKKEAFKYALLSGLAEPIGAVIGFFLLLPLMGDLSLGVVFGFVAGLMVYISLDELLPSSRIYGNPHLSLLGLCLGMLVMGLSLIGFKLL